MPPVTAITPDLAADICHLAKAAGIHLAPSREHFGEYELPDGRVVVVRGACVRDLNREHRLGVHRFKITNAIQRYSFVVFAVKGKRGLTAQRRYGQIEFTDNPVVYIFRPQELASVQSLVLRFAGDRPSKYEYALDRWHAMKRTTK